MVTDLPITITIRRQLGSGGAHIGQRLAARLNILYLDREILFHAAEELKISELDLHSRDERVTPRWQAMIESMGHGAEMGYVPPMHDFLPTDQDLFDAESKVIRRMSQMHSAVIVGRAGYYILRDLPRHLSVFLHADVAFRQQRVQEVNHLSAQDALKLINSVDQARAQYLRRFTGQDPFKANQYHLCLNTSAIGLDKAEDIILTALQARLDNVIHGGNKSAV